MFLNMCTEPGMGGYPVLFYTKIWRFSYRCKPMRTSCANTDVGGIAFFRE